MRMTHYMTAFLMAMVPVLSQAQENIEKMKGLIARTEGVTTTNETNKDPQTLALRSSQECYRFTVKRNTAIVQNTLYAFDRDAAKAYSVYRGDNESLAASYSVGGVRIGKGYDHFVLECFTDKDNPDHRYAYALEWNEAKKGKITGKLTKVYGQRPGTSKTVTTITTTLPSVTDVQASKKKGTSRKNAINGEMTNEQIDAVIRSATQKLEKRGYKDMAALLNHEWQTARQSENRDAEAIQTIVYDNEKNFIKKYRDGQTLIIDGEGNVVFSGLKGKLIIDEDGNIVATSYAGKTIVVDDD